MNHLEKLHTLANRDMVILKEENLSIYKKFNQLFILYNGKVHLVPSSGKRLLQLSKRIGVDLLPYIKKGVGKLE